MLICYYHIIVFVYSSFNQFSENLVLFFLDHLQKLEDMFDLWHDDLLVIILCQFATDGQLIGTFHRLIEITTQPCQILLILLIESCHVVQRLNSANSVDVIELPDSVPDHRAYIIVIGCFLLEESILLRRQPKP